MAVSRLETQGTNIRASNAAKAMGRQPRIGSILTRLAPISQPEELAGPMLDRIIAAESTLGQRVPLAIAAYCNVADLPIPGSLSIAIESIGYSRVRKLIQIVGLDSIHRELSSRFELSTDQLIRQSVAVAAVTSVIAKRCGVDGDLAFSAGLFANIGVPTLAYCEKGYVGLTAYVAGSSVQLHEAEQQHLQCTHNEAGYCLLTDYGFHEAICAAASLHNRQAQISIVQAVTTAESFVHQIGFDGGFAIVPPEFDEQALSALGCSLDDVPALSQEVAEWSSLASKILV